MSGIISPFGESGVLTDVRGLTIRAYCRISTNNPSSSSFDRSYNVASISYTSSDLTINFIEPVFSPKVMTSHYSWSTGSNRWIIITTSATGLNTSISIGYRRIDNTGTTHVDSGYLNGAQVGIYGGIGSWNT